MKTYKIQVYGVVQGVFFRASTKNAAIDNNLTGFVRNEPDGSVYIEATGTEEDIQKFIKWCHSGSSQSVVEKVDYEEIEKQEYDSFTIQY